MRRNLLTKVVSAFATVTILAGVMSAFVYAEESELGRDYTKEQAVTEVLTGGNEGVIQISAAQPDDVLTFDLKMVQTDFDWTLLGFMMTDTDTYTAEYGDAWFTIDEGIWYDGDSTDYSDNNGYACSIFGDAAEITQKTTFNVYVTKSSDGRTKIGVKKVGEQDYSFVESQGTVDEIGEWCLRVSDFGFGYWEVDNAWVHAAVSGPVTPPPQEPDPPAVADLPTISATKLVKYEEKGPFDESFTTLTGYPKKDGFMKNGDVLTFDWKYTASTDNKAELAVYLYDTTAEGNTTPGNWTWTINNPTFQIREVRGDVRTMFNGTSVSSAFQVEIDTVYNVCVYESGGVITCGIKENGDSDWTYVTAERAGNKIDGLMIMNYNCTSAVSNVKIYSEPVGLPYELTKNAVVNAGQRTVTATVKREWASQADTGVLVTVVYEVNGDVETLYSINFSEEKTLTKDTGVNFETNVNLPPSGNYRTDTYLWNKFTSLVPTLDVIETLDVTNS